MHILKTGRTKIFDLLGSILYSIGWESAGGADDGGALGGGGAGGGQAGKNAEDDDDDDLSRAVAALIFTNRKLQTTRCAP